MSSEIITFAFSRDGNRIHRFRAFGRATSFPCANFFAAVSILS